MRHPLAKIAIGSVLIVAGMNSVSAQAPAPKGSVVVASPTLYGNLIEHGQNGYLAETVDDWERALDDLIVRPSNRSMMAKRLLRHVERKCSLSENLWRWPAAWSTIAHHAAGRRLVVSA